MGVVVDDRAVLLDWEAGVGDLRSFGSTPSKKPTATTLAVVERCLDETNHDAETRGWTWTTCPRSVGAQPGRTVGGWEVETQHPHGPRHRADCVRSGHGRRRACGEIGPFRSATRRMDPASMDGRRPVSCWRLPGRDTGPIRTVRHWPLGVPIMGVIPTLVDLAVRSSKPRLVRRPPRLAQLVDLQAASCQRRSDGARGGVDRGTSGVGSQGGLHEPGDHVRSTWARPAERGNGAGEAVEATEMIRAEIGVVAGAL